MSDIIDIGPRKRGRPSKLSKLKGVAQLAQMAQMMKRPILPIMAKRRPIRQVGRPRTRHIVEGYDEPRTKTALNIGQEYERWQELMERQEIDSQEAMAKMLLDSWESKEIIKEPSGIQVSTSTLKDFETLRTRHKKSADEMIRSLVKGDGEQGSTVVVLSDDVARSFDMLKQGLKTNAINCMKHLLHVREKYQTQKGKGLVKPDMAMSVKAAVREEITRLAAEGMFSPSSAAKCGCKLSDRCEKVEKVEKAESNKNGDKNVFPYINNLVAENSPETVKKRPRKTLPHRVIVKVNDGESEDSDNDLKILEPNSMQTGAPTDSQENSLISYNYVIKPPISSQQNTSHSSSGLAVQTSPPQFPNFVQLVGTPQVLMPTGSNSLFLQPGTTLMYTSGNPSSHPQQTRNISTPTQTTAAVNSPMVYKVRGETVVPNENGLLKCPFCSFMAGSIGSLRTHCSHHPVPAFKCVLCEKSYLDENKLKEHFETRHEHSVHFLCQVCSKEFTSKGGLKYHLKSTHVKDFKYFCEECCKGFNTENMYINHCQKHDRQYQYKCSHCSREFNTWTTFTNHRNSCMQTGSLSEHVCSMCGDEFQNEAELNEHIDYEHCDVSRFRCICSQEFRFRKAFEDHKAFCANSMHSKKMSAAAEMQNVESVNAEDGLSNLAIINVESLFDSNNKGTDIDFDDNSSDSIQITNLESGELYTCSLSSQDGIKLEPEENSPSKSPKGIRIHACKLCEYKTPKKSHLKRHELTHFRKTGRPKLIFPKPVVPVSSKSDHTASITEKRGTKYYHARYKCDKCTRTFSSKGGIAYHQQTKHNNAYKYKCETCDKGFNTYQHYVGHKNTHTGVRPYVCPMCNVGFSYPSVLSSHKRVCKGSGMNGHLDLFPCIHCKEKFALPSALENHILETHFDVIKSSFLCVCGQEFQLQALYDFHKRSCNLSEPNSSLIIESALHDIEMGNGYNHDNGEPVLESMPASFSQPVFPS
ncbi:zinc finger protein Xfin-like [Dreissena polymorpha]|uniref:C2H2-type domain-containing protein n=1 Tax=Dreissena polymorpha TaxID=45954 RepID=A0A9D4RXW2_DREPO|nr:zinc finger protein Xfin-like [Dreissena polymorpha]XP_052214333.1 zinc finger protein Xfin-like [Dreissena polymorpha]KAH3882958.1 hypothetical protein DPMN_006905 [Dreissena polymorpha]